MWFLLSVAFAADPSPGVVLPSAVPVDAGHGELSVSGTHSAVDFFSLYESGVGSAVRGGVAPTDRLWVELGAGLSRGIDCGGSGCATTGGLLLSARYNVVQGASFSLAPIVAAGVSTVDDGYGVAGGLALEGGGSRVRGDASLAAAVTGNFLADGDPLVLPVAEAGVTFRVGTEYRHHLRLGLAMLLPDVSWRYEQDRWFVEAGITGLPANLGAERVEVGYRF